MERTPLVLQQKQQNQTVSTFPMGHIACAGFFLVPGILLYRYGAVMLLCFIFCAFAAVFVVKQSDRQHDLSMQAGTFAESFRHRIFVLAVGVRLAAETAAIGILVGEFFPNVPLPFFIGAAALITGILQLDRFNSFAGTVGSFLIFIYFVAILVFSVAVLERQLVYLAGGEGVVAANAFRFDRLPGISWLCGLPLLIMLLGGIEERDSLRIESNINDDRPGYWPVLYRTIPVYFVAFFSLVLSVNSGSALSRVIAFAVPLNTKIGGKLLQPLFTVTAVLIGINCCRCSMNLIKEKRQAKSGGKRIESIVMLLLPFAGLIVSLSEPLKVFSSMAFISGSLFAASWCVVLLQGVSFHFGHRQFVKGAVYVLMTVFLAAGIVWAWIKEKTFLPVIIISITAIYVILTRKKAD